jgi:hypothetical protein
MTYENMSDDASHVPLPMSCRGNRMARHAFRVARVAPGNRQERVNFRGSPDWRAESRLQTHYHLVALSPCPDIYKVLCTTSYSHKPHPRPPRPLTLFERHNSPGYGLGAASRHHSPTRSFSLPRLARRAALNGVRSPRRTSGTHRHTNRRRERHSWCSDHDRPYTDTSSCLHSSLESLPLGSRRIAEADDAEVARHPRDDAEIHRRQDRGALTAKKQRHLRAHHRLLLALKTNKQKRFGEWKTDLTNRGDVAFTQMPKAMLRFAEQVCIQMLNRWQRQKYYIRKPAADNGFVCVFFAFRCQNPPSLASELRSTQIRYINSDPLHQRSQYPR